LEASFEDVATIQEFTDIFVFNQTRLVDLSAGKRNVVQVGSFDDKFILDFFLSGDLDTFEHVDLSDDLFTQEVLDFDGFVVVADEGVDGEMGISESHFISVTLGNTVHHVSDLRRDGGNTGLLLSLAHPDLELELSDLGLFVGDLLDGEGNVLEASGEGTSLALDGNFSGLEVNINSFNRLKK